MQNQNIEDGLFEKEYKVMGVFIENAKTYVQLSAGALLLSVTFLHEIIGLPNDHKVQADIWLVLSWLGFLLAIVCGALYQYFAAKFLEWKSGVPRTHRGWPEWVIQHPWLPYGLMLVAFYFGGLCFAISAIKRL